jgi:hypothetical protein
MALDLCIDQPVFDGVEDGMIILLIRTGCVIIATVVYVEYKGNILPELPSRRTSIKDTSDLQLGEAARSEKCIRYYDSFDDF